MVDSTRDYFRGYLGLRVEGLGFRRVLDRGFRVWGLNSLKRVI